MLSLVHTLVSLPFGVHLNNPALAFVLAAVVHLLADSLLHWNVYVDELDKYPTTLVAGDVILGLLLAWGLLGDQILTITVLAAIAGGNFPDAIHSMWDLLSKPTRHKYIPWLNPFFKFHKKMQWETHHAVLGFIPQAALVTLALFFI